MEVDVPSTPPTSQGVSSSQTKRTSISGSSSLSVGRKPHLSKTEDRLMIKNLVLENFKSYAGVQEIGPLHHCFTAVVGPNGSGKSNVIDAILFVFGHQAKKLRHSRVSELIHKSENFPNLQYAKVSVYFQRIINTSVDGSTYDVISGSEFVVTRTAFASNESKYQINDKNVSRSEVVDLLKKHGIDMDNNRFLILQGEVEHIATMKPKAQNPGDDNGLLEYLEEIIGSNVFVEPIDQAGRELEELGVERTRRLNRLRIVEKEKDTLEVAKVKAEDHISKQKAIHDKKAILYQHERYKATQESNGVEAQHHEALTKLEESKHSMSEKDKLMIELENKVAEQTHKVSTSNKKLEKAKSMLKALDTQDVTLRENLKALQQRKKKAQTSITTETAKIQEKEGAITTLEAEKKELEAKITEKEAELSKQETNLQEMREKMSTVLGPLHQQLTSKQRELMPFKESMNESKSKMELAESQLTQIDKKTHELKTQKESLESKRSSSQTELDSLHNQLNEKKEELTNCVQQLKETEEIISKLKAQDAELTQAVIATRNKIDDAGKIKTNNSLIINLRKSVPDAISRGILGKLGELGTIDPLYDIAITTACGSLGDIVVTSTEVAQACVDILKQKKLGRATFIPLNEIRYLTDTIKNLSPTPTGSKRLFELVTADTDDIRLAFFQALGDTLVCESVEAASSVAHGKKRWKVVTLDGAVFDVTGTIAGGGTPKSGGMRTSKSAGANNASSSNASHSAGQDLSSSDLASLKSQLDAHNSKIREIRSKLQSLESQLSQLKSNQSKFSRQIETTSNAIKSSENQISEIKSRIEELDTELESKTKEAASNKKKFQTEISNLKLSYEEAANSAQSIEKDIIKLQAKIDDATGADLKKAEQAHAHTSQLLDDFRTNVTKAEVQIKSSTKAITKSKEAMEKATEDLKNVDPELAKVTEDISGLETEALNLNRVVEEANGIISSEISILKSLQEQLESQKTESRGRKEAQSDLEEKCRTVEAKLKEHRELVRLLTSKLEEVRRKKMELKVDDTEEDSSCAIAEMEDSDLENFDERDLKSIKVEISKLQAELEGSILNIQAILDYREKMKIFDEHKREVDEINAQFEAKHRELDGLRKQRLDMFMEGHSKINPKLKEMYTMIAINGSADLEITNSTDPFLDGITFSVRPPNKSWRPIHNLSGGEKTLSSLALVFALHYYKPTPLYVMDEIDAALDFKNVSIVANYIKERTKDAQFLIVSLRNFMFELADRLVGIYKTDNATKSVTINPSAFSLPSTSTAQTSRLNDSPKDGNDE